MDFEVYRLVKVIFILVLFVYCDNSSAQDISGSSIEDLIENIAANSDVELDYTSLYDGLYYFLTNPLNINSASREDLEKLPMLSDFQIKSLLNYIQENGKMLSVYELQLVHGFTMQEIQMMLPFITVNKVQDDSRFKIKNMLKYGNNQFFLRGQDVLEEQAGYSAITDSALLENPNSRYLGSPYKVYAKYKFNYKNRIYWGFTAEKDPGEEFFTGNNKNGFDYYSAHLQINDIGIVKTIALGDYEAEFGQGLVIWTGMALGKTPNVLNIRKKTQGIKKYASTNENLFMRGMAATVEYKNASLTAFYSKKSVDANISDSLGNNILSVSSFQNTGYHSTVSEMIDKDAVKEEITGVNFQYNHSLIKIGLTGLAYNYSAPLVKTQTPENQFDFQGKQNSNASIDYQFGFRDFIFFGEEAISKNGGKAFLNGILLNPAPQLSFSVMHRYYQRNYQANYASAFAEYSGNANESGLYFGLDLHPFKNWHITGYYDQYKFPWLKFGLDAPSKGHDWFLQTNYTPSGNLGMYVRTKCEHQDVNQQLNSGVDSIVNQEKYKMRFHVNTRVNEQLSLKSRVEVSAFKKGEVDEYGYMVYQDFFYELKKLPLSLSMRFALFDTDSYNTRIYAYENDILYAFSIPAYYLKGTRVYLNIKYSINKFVDIWLRYSQTYYSNTEAISSGLNQINGNTKSEIKAQLRVKF